MASATNNGILNSWKEIAAYTGRGVRTVQRWERELGFPVRRPRGFDRSAVMAVKNEVDLWMHKTPLRNERPHTKASLVTAWAHVVASESETLHALSLSLHNNMKRAVEICQAMAERRRNRNAGGAAQLR